MQGKGELHCIFKQMLFCSDGMRVAWVWQIRGEIRLEMYAGLDEYFAACYDVCASCDVW
jgi:hypothetical protein